MASRRSIVRLWSRHFRAVDTTLTGEGSPQRKPMGSCRCDDSGSVRQRILARNRCSAHGRAREHQCEPVAIAEVGWDTGKTMNQYLISVAFVHPDAGEMPLTETKALSCFDAA